MYTKIENAIITKIYFPNYFCSNTKLSRKLYFNINSKINNTTLE